ncbi:MAG: TerB family tellurite resistance protein [Hyphomicrobiaceae bacterium]
MLDKLMGFLSGDASQAEAASEEELRIAVAALLIEAGKMDERFDAGERRAIRDLLAQRFDLKSSELDQLMVAAEARVDGSEQYYPFTQLICERLSRTERVEIIEMLWRVVYADGVLDTYEDALIRQVAALINVEDRDRAAARHRALAALEQE